MTLKTLRLSDPYGTVAYQQAGAGDPVVLIHGVGMQSGAWGPQIAALSERHQVFAVDMPGHGGSDPLPEGAGLTDFVGWAVAVLDALALPWSSVAGHSMGALIAGGLAVTQPDRVARVALLNPVYRRDAQARATIQSRVQALHQGGVDIETPLNRWFADGEHAARDQVAGYLTQIDLRSYATAYGAFADGDATYADRYGDIACPLLALTGAEDPNSTPEMSHQIAAAAPQGRAVIIDHHRHMVNLTAPDAVNAALFDWLMTPTQGETP